MLRLIAACSLLALAGCNDYKPPHWEDVCVSSLTIYQPRFNTDGTTAVDRLVVCVEEQRMCVVGRLHVGSRVCPAESAA